MISAIFVGDGHFADMRDNRLELTEN